MKKKIIQFIDKYSGRWYFSFWKRRYEICFPVYYAGDNLNNCLFYLYSDGEKYNDKTFQFEFLPIYQWYYDKIDWGFGRIRYCFGCGLFSFYFDNCLFKKYGSDGEIKE